MGIGRARRPSRRRNHGRPAVDRPSSETRDAGGDDEGGKRSEGRVDRVRNATTAAAVITFPARPSPSSPGSSAVRRRRNEPITAPTSVPLPGPASPRRTADGCSGSSWCRSFGNGIRHQGVGASRRQVPLLAPGTVGQGRESDVRRQSPDSASPGSWPVWQRRARGWALDAARSPVSSPGRPDSRLPCPRTGLSEGLVDGRGGWSRTPW